METSPSVIIAIIVIVVVISLYFLNVRKHTKQNYNFPYGFSSSNLGAGYIPVQSWQFNTNFKPMSSDPLKQLSYKSNPTSQDDEITALLMWWFNYVGQMDLNVAGSVYAMCEDLQTLDSMEYYGTSLRALDTLRQLRPILINVDPSSIKTQDDIINTFGTVCIPMAISEIVIPTVTGDYNNKNVYGTFANVL
jgi:hypothetical protein